MQVPNTLIAVAAELYLALFVGLVILFLHARKLKSLVRRQQEKIMSLLRDIKEKPVEKTEPQPSPTQNYKAYLHQELDFTASQFSAIAPAGDIAAEQSTNDPLFQRILALRYAFLRAEELGTTEFGGTEDYWNIFQQALEPLLAPSVADNSDLLEELETSKKRIENLEKFKRLFFDMEKQWSSAQANAQDYYAQLMAMSHEVVDQENFTNILDRYHGVYDGIHHTITTHVQHPDSITTEHKTINITRQDPRAAEEIIKLRNVAADQHRIINQLQRRLGEANTSEEKEAVIQELQQQLHRQTRFVQESETCVQLLEEELAKAHEELSHKEHALVEKDVLDEENKRMKDTLHNFAIESGDLMQSIDDLERENEALRKNLNGTGQAGKPGSSQEASDDLKQAQHQLSDLKKQYAELEEKYLELKLG